MSRFAYEIVQLYEQLYGVKLYSGRTLGRRHRNGMVVSLRLTIRAGVGSNVHHNRLRSNRE